MKHLARALSLTLVLISAVSAGPVQKERVPADAKWLLHLDFDKFRASKVGGYLTREVLEKKLAGPKADLKRDLNFDLDITKISSITAFGTDYQSHPDANGVLLIKTDLDVQKALDGAIQKISADSGGSAEPIKKLPGSSAAYSINDDVFVTIRPDKLVLLGKSRQPVEKAAAVLEGKAASLNSSKAFSGFPEVPKAFFFVAIAEAFNEDTPLPPQAKVLKMTDGGRLVLGENAENLFLNLTLKAKSSEVVSQMQQVIQGTVALASLSQEENPDLMQLAQSVKVSSDDKMVTVGVEYPVAKAIEKLSEKAGDRKGGRAQPRSKPNEKNE
jgi:hypothetical protein